MRVEGFLGRPWGKESQRTKPSSCLLISYGLIPSTKFHSFNARLWATLFGEAQMDPLSPAVISVLPVGCSLVPKITGEVSLALDTAE